MCTSAIGSGIFFDINNCNLRNLFKESGSKYYLRYSHVFDDTLYIPDNSEIVFEGGRLSGPIVFSNTRLSGLVDLKGSTISGRVSNKTFNAGWLCLKDSISDDAPRINEIIDVCNNVFFPKGTYRLISSYDPSGVLPNDYLSSITSHIGICKSDVHLKGEKGTIFITNEVLGILSIFSQPYQIKNSVRNIQIKNITFKVNNDGKNFHGLIHTIKTMGVNGLTVKDCVFNDYWGDAICLSHYGDIPQTGERTLNQNVLIEGNLIVGGNHNNKRNGISVISGKNVIIRNNKLTNTSKNDRPGGIDIEPNNSAYTIENIRVLKNEFENIRGGGGAIGLVIFDGGPAHKVYIIGNRVYNSYNGILIDIRTRYTSDNIVIKDNYIDINTNPYRFLGNGRSKNWIIEGNEFVQKPRQPIPGEIIVENLVVKKNKSNVLTPLFLFFRSVWMKLKSFIKMSSKCSKGVDCGYSI